jgi:FkbM family methyltransferase
MIPKQRLLLSSWFKKHSSSHPITICDVGAREELFKPYNSLPKDLFKIIGFEPDEKEAHRLAEKYKNTNRTYLPYGLWSSSTTVSLSYAELAGNSSIHPPNLDVLSRTFPKKHWTNRRPVSTPEIQVKALDDVADQFGYDCDLLKVDTQGSEYEILNGAQNLLKDSVVLVLLETWTFEVHKGQALTGKILEWMNEKGFELIRTNAAADWHRKEINQLNREGLRTMVGLDLLFIRRDFDFKDEEIRYKKVVNGAALSELYGFPDLGIQVIDQNKDALPNYTKELAAAKQEIISNWSKSHEPFLFRAIRKLVSLLGYKLEKHHSSPYAPLH